MGQRMLQGVLLCLCTFCTTFASPEESKSIECSRESPSRHLISSPSGQLIFRQKKENVNGVLPCQWFIDASSFGTNIFLTLYQITGECGFQSCVIVFDGDSLEDPPVASLSSFSGVPSQQPVIVVSSSAKIFIQVAAGCDRLTFINATFSVLNCTGCNGNCSSKESTGNCDIRCPTACPREKSRNDVCFEGDLGCSCPDGR